MDYSLYHSLDSRIDALETQMKAPKLQSPDYIGFMLSVVSWVLFVGGLLLFGNAVALGCWILMKQWLV